MLGGRRKILFFVCLFLCGTSFAMDCIEVEVAVGLAAHPILLKHVPGRFGFRDSHGNKIPPSSNPAPKKLVGNESRIWDGGGGRIFVTYVDPQTGEEYEVHYVDYDSETDTFISRDEGHRREKDGGPNYTMVYGKRHRRGDGKAIEKSVSILPLANNSLLSGDQVHVTPVPDFLLFTESDYIPEVKPRPGALRLDIASRLADGSFFRGYYTDLDHNRAFSKPVAGVKVPAPGKLVVIGAHGGVDEPLQGITNEKLVELLKWLKGRGFENVAVVSCNQNVLGADGNPRLNSNWAEVQKLLRKEDSDQLPRIFVAEKGAVGAIGYISESKQSTVADPEGPYTDFSGQRYREINFSQQVWPLP